MSDRTPNGLNSDRTPKEVIVDCLWAVDEVAFAAGGIDEAVADVILHALDAEGYLITPKSVP